MPTCFYCGGNHLTSACPICAQEKTTEAIEKLGYQSIQSLDEIVSVQRDIAERVIDIGGETSEAIYELADFFRLAHAEEMWIHEKQLEILTGIHDMVKNPRATQADELFKMGVESLKRGMIKESLKLLQDAVELNPLDYRLYIAMGHTYLIKDDLENALNGFGYALKNAHTNYYKSFALLLIARTKYCMGKIEESVKDARRAMELSSNYPEAYYQYAVYEAQRLKRGLR